MHPAPVVLVMVALAGCAPTAPAARPDPEPLATVPPIGAIAIGEADAGAVSGAGCIVVGEGAPPATVEGRLGAADGQGFVLRLAHPRCVVGLAHAAFVTEVFVASTGADLRPLVDASIRLVGSAIAGTTDVGGPAIVLLATSAARLVRADPAVP